MRGKPKETKDPKALTETAKEAWRRGYDAALADPQPCWLWPADIKACNRDSWSAGYQAGQLERKGQVSA